jgi:hypothetical protein
MNNLLTATLVATTISTTAIAGMGITGTYEGTITDGSGATYAQDLDLTLTGTVDSTTVTATIEDLTGGSTLATNQLFIETAIEGLNFKGGKYKGQNGSGLLQTESTATNKMAISTDVAGVNLKVSQVSGNANATVDTSASYAGVNLKVQNITNSERFLTASTSVAGIDINIERQKTAIGTNTGGSASATISGLTVTGVMIDVEDATGITQDDGILGDISDASNGNTVTGVVASTDTVLGTVTGKYIDKNDATTYVGKLQRGIMEYGYTKTENTDGVFDAVLTVSF